jgi:cyclic pyranopterin phosphate synthase
MPEDDYVWLPKASILSFEEIDQVVRVFSLIGVDKVRLTGGEPLLRHNLPHLIELLAANERIRDIALTTNGVLLSREAETLSAAGLSRVTVSLDTVRADRFEAFNRASKFASVVEGIAAVGAAGLDRLKINSVVIRGFNDDEIVDLLEFAGAHGAELRFIEYMDVGGATDWSMKQVVSRDEILEVLGATYGEIEQLADGTTPSAPAERFRLPDGRTFGIVASTTGPFCRSCDRGRLTADGMFYLCLYADTGLDMRELIRSDASNEAIADRLRDTWRRRVDRGAEERVSMRARGVLHKVAGLRSDPHREMHTRGG